MVVMDKKHYILYVFEYFKKIVIGLGLFLKRLKKFHEEFRDIIGRALCNGFNNENIFEC